MRECRRNASGGRVGAHRRGRLALSEPGRGAPVLHRVTHDGAGGRRSRGDGRCVMDPSAVLRALDACAVLGIDPPESVIRARRTLFRVSEIDIPPIGAPTDEDLGRVLWLEAMRTDEPL